MTPKISVLVAARKNSKYLAKFMHGYFGKTDNQKDTEILVMLNADDTWNADLAHYYWDRSMAKFFSEDYKLGRAGLHQYFNDLLQHATGDWIVYFCEDHYITKPGWDTQVRRLISGANFTGILSGRDFPLDPNEPWVIVPKFDNAGAMNHIVSRGFVKALGDKLGNHGWIDSYINDLALAAWGKHGPRLIRMDQELFHDFTHDQPNPMSDAHLQSEITDAAKQLPKHGSEVYQHKVAMDAEKLKQFTEGK